LDLEVIDDRDVALAVLEPVRAKVLAALVEPGSATTVANAIGESRQKVNYHLRTLEDHGLVHLVEERPRRGLTERVMVASARSYVMSPAMLGDSAADPAQTDRLSAQYLVALAARIVAEVGELARRATRAERSLATLAIHTEIRFASASERAAFTRELGTAVAALAARYHDETAPRGRWHRLVVAAHPHLSSTRTSTTKA
jgi:DNA-binding transcriptional ArsR family regulator